MKSRVLEVCRVTSSITLRLVYSPQFEEYQVRWIENGSYFTDKSYFTSDKRDAYDTMAAMRTRILEQEKV